MTQEAEDKAVATVEKSSIEKYSVRIPKVGWAIIMVDVAAGLLSIHSDYGDWAYHWAAPGLFKEFLLEIDRPYLMGKLEPKEWFDERATVRQCNRVILEAAESGKVSQEQTMEAYRAVEQLNGLGADLWFKQFMQSKALRKVFDDFESVPVQNNFTPQLRIFMERLWPAFITFIKSEVESEKNRAGGGGG